MSFQKNPLLAPEIFPSAPPSNEHQEYYPIASARIVEPFSVAVDESTPLQYADRTSEPAVMNPHSVSKFHSNMINQQISQGNTDGYKIVNEEYNVARRSQNTGNKLSNDLDRRVWQGNNHNLQSNIIDIKSVPLNPGYDITEMNDYRYDATKDIIHKKHPDPKRNIPGGYEINEYKSIYEQSHPSGDYQMSEYKSIYDE